MEIVSMTGEEMKKGRDEERKKSLKGRFYQHTVMRVNYSAVCTCKEVGIPNGSGIEI